MIIHGDNNVLSPVSSLSCSNIILALRCSVTLCAQKILDFGFAHIFGQIISVINQLHPAVSPESLHHEATTRLNFEGSAKPIQLAQKPTLLNIVQVESEILQERI